MIYTKRQSWLPTLSLGHLNRPRVTKEGACVKQRVKNVVENGTRNTGHPTEVLKRSQGTSNFHNPCFQRPGGVYNLCISRHIESSRTLSLLVYSNKKATVLKAEEDKEELYSLMEGSLSGQVWFAK